MKHLRYLLYVLKHKWFVILGAWKLQRAVTYYRAPWLRLLIHDWSKFTPAEWGGYVERFFGDYRNGFETKESFGRAWKHHYRTNDHHWEHWKNVLYIGDHEIDSGLVKEMPRIAVFEMLADWMGAGRGITGKWEMPEWYAKNYERIELHIETRALVNRLVKNYEKFTREMERLGWEEAA